MGRAGGVEDWTRHGFTQGSNDTAKVTGSFQETAPRKTAENTVKHRDGGVGSVVANQRGGGESLVVITTLIFNHFFSLKLGDTLALLLGWLEFSGAFNRN